MDDALPDELAARLRVVGIDPGVPLRDENSPWPAWLRLRERYGRRATLIDLYHLEAARQAVPPEALPAADRARLKAAALPVIFPGFTEYPWTGRPGEGIEVVGYDPDWPRRFRAGYTEAKSGFILDTLDDAEQWAVATGWRP